jgi:translation elongation factor EF-Tu-like GTPase
MSEVDPDLVELAKLEVTELLNRHGFDSKHLTVERQRAFDRALRRSVKILPDPLTDEASK